MKEVQENKVRYDHMYFNIPASWCPKHIHQSTINLLQHEVVSIQDAEIILFYLIQSKLLIPLQSRKITTFTTLKIESFQTQPTIDTKMNYTYQARNHMSTIDKLKEEMEYEDAVSKEIKTE